MSKLAIVSGGGSGIGAAIADKLVMIGYRVLIVGRRASALEKTKEAIGNSIDSLVSDVSDPEQVSELAKYVEKNYGGVDALINNAGGNFELLTPSATTDLEGIAANWIGNFKVNVLTTVLLTEALSPLLRERGRVVLTSSIAAFRGSGTGSYAAAKSALHPYVYDLAKRLGSRRITVNAIAPGYVAETEFFGDRLSSARRQQLQAETLTSDVTHPKQVASLIGWLSTDDAAQVTGQILQINGGAQLGR
ncbi:SDR family NAD(P)-dependent oxidoreductase [Agrobacterium vitis]|uniref:SDR family oxidoreductase n=1 Tax=Agrobacterium vitis TaxID=373 RepID=A0AAE2UYU4_AGRVI|nr:SDR family oxidoreductase [Agrobacterium vitis]MBF2717664.1 SDR family oxidoreductase [Agrobacterium vitis]MVA22604.1 SDR family oxidoreductase [Agrobacterium vitis]